MRRTPTLVLIVTVVVLTATVAAAMAWTSPYEEQVKAAFLFNFTKFVTWPDETFPDAEAPVRIAVLDQDELLENLESAVNGKKVRGREVVVRDLESMEDLGLCQILFVGEGAVEAFAESLAHVDRSPILTVGESEGFAENGGIVNFILVENKVRFEINPDAADRSGLKVSAKLLDLAEIVGK